MAFTRNSFIIAVALLTAGSVLAQRNKTDHYLEQQRIASAHDNAAKRALLAEALVRAKESPGREFDASYRRALVERLKTESIEELERRSATGNLAPSPNALGDTRADLTYTTFQQPCRVIDTRIVGGTLPAGQTRSFIISAANGFELQGGTPGGCGIPFGAASVQINFVAVSPEGLGNLKGAAYPNTMPATGSILNYQLLTPTLNIANGLLFPICDTNTASCSKDITIQANGSGTQIVADVLGYAMPFRKEPVKNIIAEGSSNQNTTWLRLVATCTNYPGANVSITAPVAGKVVVRSNVKLYLGLHAPSSTESRYDVNLATSTPYCNGSQSNNWAEVSTRAFSRRGRSISSATAFVPLDTVYSIGAGETLNITLNGQSWNEATGDEGYISGANIIAKFIPD